MNEATKPPSEAEIALVRLARQSAATWQRVRGEAFLGHTIVETANTIYRFENGLFQGRASRGSSAAWDAPAAMSDLEIIGFLTYEGGFWSLSPRWQPGALAVLWRMNSTSTDRGFTLTSPTVACTVVRPEPMSARDTPERSDVFDVPGSKPPVVRRPPPPSMTRLQPLPPAPPPR